MLGCAVVCVIRYDFAAHHPCPHSLLLLLLLRGQEGTHTHIDLYSFLDVYCCFFLISFYMCKGWVGVFPFYIVLNMFCFLKEQYVIYLLYLILNNIKVFIYRQTLGNVEILAHLTL